MDLVTKAYHALSSEEPPHRGRARQHLRRAIATLSAVADPHTTEAMRIAAFLRETDPFGSLIVVRGKLLSANAALLALSRVSAHPPERASDA